MSHKRRRQPVLFETLPESPVLDLPDDDSVIKEVMALPEKYRTVTLLRYYQELSLEEIAAILGMRRNSVSTRLMRAREMLRKRIGLWYFDD